eukprot:Tamp_26682.p1 GENE.Tamp_26682~~Tamp_26682.p1  ORF type:complete len:179 (-),score=31.52 Tamp_26682:349-885(-)
MANSAVRFRSVLLGLMMVATVHGRDRSDAVDLADVRALTFRRGQMTASRRVAAVPQLTCVKGGACAAHALDVVQCTNVGEDDRGEVQWRCDADLDVNVKLGEINVNCEGWTSSDDHLKLRGSCALEYTLKYTSSQGAHDRYSQDQYQRNGAGHGRYSRGRRGYYDDYSTQQSRYMTNA